MFYNFSDGSLLPLNHPRRLARHIIHHAVDALDFVDDAGGGAAEEFHVKGIEVGGRTANGAGIGPTRGDFAGLSFAGRKTASGSG